MLAPLLQEAVRRAPRRYRMPPLPADAEAAAAARPETALAFAIDAARQGADPADAQLRDMFTNALTRLIAQALAPERGDPAFQALVLQAGEPEVREYVRLATAAAADRRAVRAAVDAIAHPGKTRGMASAPPRDALSLLHRLAAEGSWQALEQAAGELLPLAPALQQALHAITDSPARRRLARLDELLAAPSVRRYLALCERRGPLAGSDAAAAQGRASARAGERAEAAAADSLVQIAALLNAHAGAGESVRAVAGLRTPAGFPGVAAKAKEEWDLALVQDGELLLLAEVKASPAAAASDLPRLLRGLERLAQARAGETYAFACADGKLMLRGETLRALRPEGRALPPHVFYACEAPVEPQPQVLAAASKAVLLAEPASIAFARQLAADASPADAALLPVWQDLATAPRLHATLHQYDTACAARAAMLHPQDLLEAVQATMAAAACTPATSSSSSSCPPSGAPPSP